MAMGMVLTGGWPLTRKVLLVAGRCATFEVHLGPR